MTEKSKKTPFWIKLVLIIAGIAILIIFAINPILKNILAGQVESKLTGNFYYTYDDLSVDLLTRSVVFEGVKWKFPKDTTDFDQSGSVDKFGVRGISLFSLIGETDIKIDKLFFENPTMLIRIKEAGAADKDSTKTDDEFNFYSLIKGNINSLKVNKIEINNGNASWINPENKKLLRKINSVDLDVNSIELDSAIASSNNGWFKLENVILDCDGGELFLADSIHKIQTGKIHLDYSTSVISIDSLQMVPLFSRDEMSEVSHYETDRIEILSNVLKINGIDIKKLMVQEKLRIKHILIDGFDLVAFRDKNPPFPMHQRPALPHLALKNLKLNVHVDSVEIKNANIRYEQLSAKTQEVGAVYFSDLNARIVNITNDSLSYKEDSTATMSVSTNLMGQGNLAVDFVFNLTAQNGDHWFKGTLGEFDLTELNGIFKPLTTVSVRSGRVDEMNFNVRLNNDISDGEMTFLYSGLKIDKLDKDDLDDEGLDNVFVSFVANTFLVKQSNPAGNSDPRVGIVHFERIKEKSIFNFWWKSMFTGMTSTVVTVKENK